MMKLKLFCWIILLGGCVSFCSPLRAQSSLNTLSERFVPLDSLSFEKLFFRFDISGDEVLRYSGKNPAILFFYFKPCIPVTTMIRNFNELLDKHPELFSGIDLYCADIMQVKAFQWVTRQVPYLLIGYPDRGYAYYKGVMSLEQIEDLLKKVLTDSGFPE